MTVWNSRLDIAEALEAAGWQADAEYDWELMRKGDAHWAQTNDSGDSGLTVGNESIDFPSGIPSAVIIAACLAATEATP